MNKNLKVLSLFDGISVGRLALQRLGITPTHYFASEIKESAIMCSKDNFPDIIHIGDVTKVKFMNGVLYTENGNFNIGQIDLLIGGSPCQDFSQANPKKLGLKGLKSKLFYEYYRLLKETNPTYFLLENVKMDSQSNINLNKLMGVSNIIINSSLVCGALRNRYYWTNINNVGIPENANISFQSVLDYGYTDRYKARCLTVVDSRPNKTPVKMFHRYYSTGFTTLIFKSKEHYLSCVDHYNKYFKGLSAKQIDPKVKKYNIDLSIYDGVRYMNKHEMERCQTLPEDYCKCLDRNDTADVCGDGWTTDVIVHILKNMYKKQSIQGELF